MNASAIGRRQALRGAGVAAGGLALGLGLAQPAAAATGTATGNRPSGSYLVVRTDDATPQDPAPTPTTGVVGFAAGGMAQTIDINPAAGLLLGSWESSGSHFEAVVWGGQAAAGPQQPATTVRVRISGQFSEETISGKYTFQVWDAATGAAVFSGTGTFKGRDIDA